MCLPTLEGKQVPGAACPKLEPFNPSIHVHVHPIVTFLPACPKWRPWVQNIFGYISYKGL